MEAFMAPQLAIVLAYLLAMLAIGLIFRRRSAANTVEFFLAGRRIGRLVLFFTMAATNFSAFTIFGLSGAGYRIGYAFYPVMGFGTGFMALGMWVIGSRIRELAAGRGYITPSDFILDRYGSPALKGLFSLVMILFTLPYVAIQAIAAGRSLEALAGLPYWAGALLVMGFTALYVLLGGMRSVAWTDLAQTLMVLGLTLTGFILIAVRVRGLESLPGGLAARYPGLFSRPGLDGSMVPGVWLGYLLLWLFADPMFPQLFQRFLAARDTRSLKTTVVLYPLITTFLFFLTVSIGVLGRAVFPDLSAAQSESVYALLLARFASPFLSTLLLTGGLAALMSTLDSQLLTMASMIGLDFSRRRAAPVWLHRLIVLGIAAAGYLIALRPPQTILDFVNRTSFTGLAALAPVVLGGLYWRRANRYGALAGILAGEAITVLSFFRVVQVPGVLPVIPVLAAGTVAFVVVSLLTQSPREENTELVARVSPAATGGGRFRHLVPAALVFAGFFALANDFWAWHRRPVFLAGLPLWVWYYILLGILLAGAYALLLGRERSSIRQGGACSSSPAKLS
jgi:SSS family solute:Na+ symporter